jgi:drug/metabolite transporter (DMT)-like permease
MSVHVVLLVLLAAALHASWNALIKLGSDRLVTMAILAGSTALITGPLLPFTTMPKAQVWPYLIATSFVHLGYMSFLIQAYKHGDFGQVYPIARGTAPLLTALAASLLLGEHLSTVQWVAIAMIAGSLISLAFFGSDVERGKGLFYAFGTACFIATYTLIDGTGARLSGDVHSYTLWLFFLHGFPLFVVTYVMRRKTLLVRLKENWRAGVVAGILSILAYWIVLWAMTLSALAPIAAVRETSVIFAALIATLALKEPFGVPRIISAALVALGVLMLSLAP